MEPAADSAPVTFTLEGQVVSEDGHPLPGATIQVPGTRQVYITNSEGYFSFIGTKSTQPVQVSLAGYSETQAQLRRGMTTPVVLQLQPGTRFKSDGRIKKTSTSGKVR